MKTGSFVDVDGEERIGFRDVGMVKIKRETVVGTRG